jgi:hypothetical protein
LFLNDSLIVVQFYTICFLSLGVLVYYLGVLPFIQPCDLTLETGNELVLLILTYFIFMFSDWIQDESARSSLGWVFNGLIGA